MSLCASCTLRRCSTGLHPFGEPAWEVSMAEMTTLGRSEVRVSRLGLGVMVWGEASGVQRVMPAKSAYGGTNAADEQAAFDARVAAGIKFFDTAGAHSGRTE